MTIGLIAAVAEFERDLLIERTRAGLKRAVEHDGRKLGRRPALSQAQQEEVLQARGAGISLGELARRFTVSRSAIQRIERRHRQQK